MTAPTTATGLSPELKGLLRRVKLGKTLDTLPERLTLARTAKLSHAEFLELVPDPARGLVKGLRRRLARSDLLGEVHDPVVGGFAVEPGRRMQRR